MLNSPVSGLVKPLKEVNDTVFSSDAMGRGIAIEPNEGDVYSPVNGVVTMVFPSSHAIGIQSDEGAEILIHIGINTVSLQGEHFSSLVEQGDRIVAGQHLIKFDVVKIKKAGYDVITPMIITNTEQYEDFVELKSESIQAKEALLTIVSK